MSPKESNVARFIRDGIIIIEAVVSGWQPNDGFELRFGPNKISDKN